MHPGWRSPRPVCVTGEQGYVQLLVDRQHRGQAQYFQDAADLAGRDHHPEPGVTRLGPLVAITSARMPELSQNLAPDAC